MPDPVLLTGATGFVGRAVLAELVASGITVHAVSRKRMPAQDFVSWHTADLLTPEDRAAVAGLAPRLIHCAWEVEHGLFWTSPANTLWHIASLDLVQRFRAAGGRQVIAIGSCAEYDALVPGPWNETRPIAPTTPYGKAKAALHRDLADLYGESLIWARLFHLYGPGEDPRRFVPSLIAAFRENRPAHVRAADLIRDYASTAHVARCLLALQHTNAFGAFDIGSGSPKKLGDLAQIIALENNRTDLLHLTHVSGPEDPMQMAPDLTRLFGYIGNVKECPEKAMLHYIRATAAC
jgi:nucleoside-diphosphate-sugar epimerase